MEPTEKILYTRKEAAARLSISVSTLDCAIRRGMLKVTHKGSRVLIHATELDKFGRRDAARIWPPKENGKTVNRSGQMQLFFRKAG